jgi:hypothetical protein
MLPTCRCRALPVLPAILLLILPKCPLCLAAWFGLFGVAGVSSWIAAVWGMPVGAALLAIAVAALAVRGFRNRDPRPLPLGLLGAFALLAGKQFTEVWLLGLGGSLLLLACTLRPASQKNINKRKVETTYDNQSICR